MQYKVMRAMGVLDSRSAERRYQGHIERARRDYNHPNRPFPSVAPRLRAEGRYPTLYWGARFIFSPPTPNCVARAIPV